MKKTDRSIIHKKQDIKWNKDKEKKRTLNRKIAIKSKDQGRGVYLKI